MIAQSPLRQQAREGFREFGGSYCSREGAEDGHPDLHRGEKLSRAVDEAHRPCSASVPFLRQLLETPLFSLYQRHLRHREEAVEDHAEREEYCLEAYRYRHAVLHDTYFTIFPDGRAVVLRRLSGRAGVTAGKQGKKRPGERPLRGRCTCP